MTGLYTTEFSNQAEHGITLPRVAPVIHRRA